MTARQKAEELIEVFSNDNTRDSERKAYEHAIFHVEEMLNVINYLDDREFYKQVLTILKDERN
jgi:hypothetical protein